MAICDFFSDLFRDFPERFLLAAGIIVPFRVLKILPSSDVSARADGAQSSVKNWKDKIKCIIYNQYVLKLIKL